MPLAAAGVQLQFCEGGRNRFTEPRAASVNGAEIQLILLTAQLCCAELVNRALLQSHDPVTYRILAAKTKISKVNVLSLALFIKALN